MPSNWFSELYQIKRQQAKHLSFICLLWHCMLFLKVAPFYIFYLHLSLSECVCSCLGWGVCVPFVRSALRRFWLYCWLFLPCTEFGETSHGIRQFLWLSQRPHCVDSRVTLCTLASSAEHYMRSTHALGAHYLYTPLSFSLFLLIFNLAFVWCLCTCNLHVIQFFFIYKIELLFLLCPWIK